jgi:multidrug resistance efflux pump
MDKVKSLSPSKRKHYRIQVPVKVEIGEQIYETADWSSGGFRIVDFKDGKPEEEFEVSLSIPFQGYWVTSTTKAALVRFEEEGGVLAARFVDLPERTRELLDYFARGLLSGEMSSVDGAIRRLDTPVTPVETSVNADPGAPSLRSRVSRWARYSIYGMAGLALTWFVGTSFYNRVWRLEITTASLSAPAESILSPTDGWIKELYVSEGEWVQEGDTLFRMIDKEASANERAAARRVAESEIAYQQVFARHEVEVNKIELYRSVLETRMQATESRLRLLANQGEILKRNFERATKLFKSGAGSVREMDASEAAYAQLLAEIEIVKSDAAVDAVNLAALDSGFLIENGRFQANLPEIEAELAFAESKLKLENQYASVQGKNDSMVVKAPFAGRIASRPKSSGTSIREGAEVLVLEQGGIRLVEAWLTTDEAAFVRVNDTAIVELRSLDYEFVGRVIELGSSTDSESASMLAGAGGMKAVIRLESLVESDLNRGITFEDAMVELVATNSVGLLARVDFNRVW